MAAVTENGRALQFASENLRSDPVLLQYAGQSYSFLFGMLGALAASAAAMTVGLLILASVIVPSLAPEVVGAALLVTGLASAGFFAYKVVNHQMMVNACGEENIPTVQAIPCAPEFSVF